MMPKDPNAQQIEMVIDAMTPIIHNLTKIRDYVASGKFTPSAALRIGKKFEERVRLDRSEVASERGEPYACLLDPLIQKIVNFNRTMEEHIA
jgi:hypothetical protein